MGLITDVRDAWSEGGMTPLSTKELSAGQPQGGAAWWLSRAGEMRQLRQIGNGSSSSIVVACLQVLTNAFTEAPVRVVEPDPDGLLVPVRDHPLVAKVERPNDFMTSDLLWQHYIWSSRLDGNAYYFKERSAAGRVAEIWPLRSDLVEPRTIPGSNSLIDYYSYRPRGTETRIPPSEILHLRFGLDPTNHAKGLAPLKVVLKEILGDEEASRFSASLLSNMAIPGVILTPKGDGLGPRQPEADQIRDKWQERFGRDRRGEPLVLTGAMDVEMVSFSPQQMDLKQLRRVPEERVSGVLGVPAILAGLGAGIESSSGKSETVALIETFTEITIIPDWRRIGRQLTFDLLPEWDLRPGRSVEFDTSDVRALQDDENEIWERSDVGIRGGWLTVAEGKKMVGLEPGEHDDVYLRSIGTEAIPSSEAPLRLDPGNGSRRVRELSSGD